MGSLFNVALSSARAPQFHHAGTLLPLVGFSIDKNKRQIPLRKLVQRDLSLICESFYRNGRGGEDRHSPLSYNMALGERILIVPPGTPEKEALSLMRYELDGVGKLED